MAKYLPMYRCMACGGIIRKIEMPKELRTPIELSDEKVEVICIGAANPFFQITESEKASSLLSCSQLFWGWPANRGSNLFRL